jgi:hypothetical protein
MAEPPRMRRWTDPRDGALWEVLFVPGVEEDPPPVRHAREGLLFRGEGGEFHSPSPYGWDLEALTDQDLGGLLDQARQEKARAHEAAGWGTAAEVEEPRRARGRRLRSPLRARASGRDRGSPERE